MQLQKYSNDGVCVFGTSIAEVLKEQCFSFFKRYKCSKKTIAVNLTPAEYHFEINKEILGEHKCHLFTEKPMADTVEQGAQLLELAQQNNLNEAELWYRHVLSFAPYDSNATRGLSQILALTSRTAEAKRLCQEYQKRIGQHVCEWTN